MFPINKNGNRGNPYISTLLRFTSLVSKFRHRLFNGKKKIQRKIQLCSFLCLFPCKKSNREEGGSEKCGSPLQKENVFHLSRVPPLEKSFSTLTKQRKSFSGKTNGA